MFLPYFQSNATRERRCRRAEGPASAPLVYIAFSSRFDFDSKPNIVRFQNVYPAGPFRWQHNNYVG